MPFPRLPFKLPPFIIAPLKLALLNLAPIKLRLFKLKPFKPPGGSVFSPSSGSSFAFKRRQTFPQPPRPRGLKLWRRFPCPS